MVSMEMSEKLEVYTFSFLVFACSRASLVCRKHGRSEALSATRPKRLSLRYLQSDVQVG